MGLGLLGLSACRERFVPLEAAPTPSDSCYYELTAVYRGPARISWLEAPTLASANVPLHLVPHYTVQSLQAADTATFSAEIDPSARAVTVSGSVEYRTYVMHGLCLTGLIVPSFEATSDLTITLPAGRYELRIASASYTSTYDAATMSLTVE